MFVYQGKSNPRAPGCPEKPCIPVTEVQGNEAASHALGPVGHIGATDAHLGSGARCACWLVDPTDCGYIVIKMCIYIYIYVCVSLHKPYSS